MIKISTLFLFQLLIVGMAFSQMIDMPVDFEAERFVSDATIDQVKNLNGPVDRATTEEFIIDYDFLDETFAMNNFYNYGRFVWELNDAFVQSDALTLRWGAVAFDNIVTDAGVTIPKSSATMTIDSFGIVIGHINSSGNTDRMIVNLVRFTGGVPANPTFMNNIIWSDTVETDSSISPGVGANGIPLLVELIFAPDTAVNTLNQGESFGVRVDFFGDTATTDFYVIAGYRDDCSDLCGASETSLGENTWAFGNWGSFSGVNTVVFNTANCDMASAMDCGEWFIQNLLIRAWVTAEVEFNALITAPTTDGCGGDVIGLNVSSSGGAAPLTYSWAPTTGLSDPTIPNPQVVVGQSDVTYSVTVTDNNGDSVVTSVTINSNDIQVAVADDSITCGGSVTLTAIPSGETFGTQYSWGGGSTTFANTVNAAGVYSVTVTNNAGCSATDDATVTLTGVSQVVDFEYPDPICQNQTIQFTNTSSSQGSWLFTWYFGDGDSIVGTTAAHAYSTFGNFTLELKADSGNCSLSASENIVVLPASNAACVSGIEELPFAESITIAPSPASSSIVIGIADAAGSAVDISIYNINGKVMLNRQYDRVTSLQEGVDVSTYSSGIYYVKFESNGKIAVKKFAVTQ